MKPVSRWLICGMYSAFAVVFLSGPAIAQPAPAPQQTKPPTPPSRPQPPPQRPIQPTPNQPSSRYGTRDSQHLEGCTQTQIRAGECAQRNIRAAEQARANFKSKFPHATRKEPKVKTPDAKEYKALTEGLKASNNHDDATALKDLQPIADNSTNLYAKALAMRGLAEIKYHSGDTKGAIALEKQALDSGMLDNDSYFPGLVALATMYIKDEDYSNALTPLETWSKESGEQSAYVEALKGNAYYRLQKYPEAVTAIQKAKSLSKKPESNWDQIEMASLIAMDKYDEAAKLAEAALAKDPNNRTLLQNVIVIDMHAHQNKKAQALLDRARANGQIKDATGYLSMARTYDILAQGGSDPKVNAMKAVGVLKEGMDKGIVPPGYDSYKLLGDSYTIAADYKNAVLAYAKAAPDARTGEVDSVRGQLLEHLGQHKEARDALKQAFAKGGFKNTGTAYLALGNAELALKEKTAAIAAYKQAEQDPATQANARHALKRLGHQ